MDMLFYVQPYDVDDANNLSTRAQAFREHDSYPVLAIGWDEDGGAFFLTIGDRNRMQTVVADDCQFITAISRENQWH